MILLKTGKLLISAVPRSVGAGTLRLQPLATQILSSRLLHVSGIRRERSSTYVTPIGHEDHTDSHNERAELLHELRFRHQERRDFLYRWSCYIFFGGLTLYTAWSNYMSYERPQDVEWTMHYPYYPWPSGSPNARLIEYILWLQPPPNFAGSFDYASVRRGWEVYKGVCAACHSHSEVRYLHFVDNFMTLDEAKAEAAQHNRLRRVDESGTLDIPFRYKPLKYDDDNGDPIVGPGLVTDCLPLAYQCEAQAKAQNGGANPIDFSLDSPTTGREGGEDYIFSLLMGYRDPPAGVQMEEGLYYNAAFPGGQIAMPQQLFNETIEYEDGTEPTASQLAKDVSHFLAWADFPHRDTLKRLGVQMLWCHAWFTFGVWCMYLKAWNQIKVEKFAFKYTPLKRLKRHR